MTDIRALVFDFGGVLTTSLTGSMEEWCEEERIDHSVVRKAMASWFGPEYGGAGTPNPIHALERGELDVADFEQALATMLTTVDGLPVASEGLIKRMFRGFVLEEAMYDVLRKAKAAGFTTALLSNSWGLDYPREEWEQLFDVVVISGEVKMRKPEPEIFELIIGQLGCEPAQCVFVDDLQSNIDAAIAVGMVGIRHVTPKETIDRLEAILETGLRA